MARILLVEDEANARRVLSLGLQMKGHQVSSAADEFEAKSAMQVEKFDIILTDLRMKNADSGLAVVRSSKQLQPEAKVLLMTAYASAETAVIAIKEGAFDYMTKPISGDDLAMAVEAALSDRDDQKEQKENVATHDLIGDSVIMQRVRQRLYRAAKRHFTVLISGESGTGKELAARTLHQYSKRQHGPFIPVHCGAIPSELFESELFGHKKGSFTGADQDRKGLIESANGGILFLDEIGEMPLPAQVKLLRVLQERKVRRVGDDLEHDIDIQVVAATNRDLVKEVEEARFREDLFYRLNVIPIYLAPLRQRREDIEPLIHHIIAKWQQHEDDDISISPACIEHLSNSPLLGNVRELENKLQNLLAMSEDGVLDESFLDDGQVEAAQHDTEQALCSLAALQESQMNLDQWLHHIEQALIEQALSASDGNTAKAATVLGMSSRSLRYRLEKKV
ncbi:MAG: sigma-54 dependent transcriptional regulator [Mariprofundaceae bacterium]|nr:sigma-54 dependent transcriptional regulator [Mariprofundaceae bacterium]